MSKGTCTTHSWNDGVDDEAEPKTALNVDELLEHKTFERDPSDLSNMRVTYLTGPRDAAGRVIQPR